MSKINEKIVAIAIASYLDTNNLLPDIQPGIRKGHSTETVLLWALFDVYGAIDRFQLTALELFGVSASLDTVDHEILIERLNVGVSGALLLWLRLFLSEQSL